MLRKDSSKKRKEKQKAGRDTGIAYPICLPKYRTIKTITTKF